jgi:glycerol-3-phosphate O-acyltransferase
MLFSQLIKPYLEKGHFSAKIIGILHQFLSTYEQVLVQKKIDPLLHLQTMKDLIEKVDQQLTHPYNFQPFHKRVKEPFDYQEFGLNFIRPLIDWENSTLRGIENIEKMRHQLNCKHNVILLANHQIEADPQVINLLLEPVDKKLGDEMIFIAGERVIVDPLAVPFSKGCNLLCIYSKKYIDFPPENRAVKQLHNKKTMDLMSSLLAEGGHCIYVALSGGRDRRNAEGQVEVASFDPNNLEMFQLMAKKAKTPTHFYPLSLATFKILPPPESTQIELGEARITQGGPVHLHFGNEIHFDQLPIPESLDKFTIRQWKTEYVYNIVKQNYLLFNVDY